MQNNERKVRGDAGRRFSSFSPLQWAALVGGGSLAILGITRRSKLGWALAASGGTIAFLGASRSHSRQKPSFWTSILINASPHEVYRFWRDFENLPRFMNRLESVRDQGNGRSRWTALGPGGRTIRWDAEITGEQEDGYIEWRSLPGSDVDVSGRVEFKQAASGRGTLVRSRIEYNSAPGMPAKLAKFLSKSANFLVRDDMRRLEALIETCEIPTTEGQPHGKRDFVTGLFRVADPTKPIRAGSSVRDTLAARRSIA